MYEIVVQKYNARNFSTFTLLNVKIYVRLIFIHLRSVTLKFNF
jgi:hypothetical protein